MSRIGNKIIQTDASVKVALNGSILHVEGSKGKMDISIPKEVKLTITPENIEVHPLKEANRNLQGLFRSLIQNAVSGVKNGWSKQLELVGVGYRAESTGNQLTLHLGFAQPVIIQAPDGIVFTVAENKIIVTGVDKYLVGEIAAKVRDYKKPEPYKGKGIRYSGEHIRKKLGKAAKAVGGAAGAK